MAKENRPPEGKDWSGAVDEVLDTVAEHEAAIEEAEERQRPKSRTPMLVGALTLLVLVGVWNAWVLTRPPESLPPEVVSDGLRYTVQMAAEAIQDFRAEQGRLPSAAEVADYLDDFVVYVVTIDGFAVTAMDGEVQVTYDGSVPLEVWMAETGGGS